MPPLSSLSSPPPPFTIQPVRTPTDLAAVTCLIKTYTTSLEIDLTFQNLAVELSTLPGGYSPESAGELLLARQVITGQPIGCVAIRFLSSGCCEMKRLYVCPESRGMGLGKALVESIIVVARQMGYVEMRLDTLADMKGARRVYETLGFVEIQPYYENPLVGVSFWGLRLD